MIVAVFFFLCPLSSGAATGTVLPFPADGDIEKLGDAIVAYQVGAFLSRDNAEHLVQELLGKGFSADVNLKAGEKSSFWVVTINAPSNPFENFKQDLFDAGYPSFRVVIVLGSRTP